MINMKRTSHSLWQLILRCELVLTGLFWERRETFSAIWSLRATRLHHLCAKLTCEQIFGMGRLAAMCEPFFCACAVCYAAIFLRIPSAFGVLTKRY